jgi:hypothetical protein
MLTAWAVVDPPRRRKRQRYSDAVSRFGDRRAAGGRQADLERLAPGRGILARIDRGAWAALSQGAPGTWSWGRALATVALAMACGVVIYLTVYREPAFLVGLALVYAYLIYRARAAHERYRRRAAPR